MDSRLTTVVVFSLLTLCALTATAQHGDRVNRRAGILTGNSTHAVFVNSGVIGQPAGMANRGAWPYWTNGYIGDMTPLLGIEFPIRDYNNDGIADTVHSVVTCPVDRPTTGRDEDPLTGLPWTFEPLPGFFAPVPNQSPAVSNRPETWPATWPDHPEWGSGVWNGLYGPNTFVGSQETYVQMDDENDMRFNFAQNNARGIVYHPDSLDLSRYGAGIRMSVRYIQVAHPLFKDVLFRVFDIRNESSYRYSKMVFGTLVGTYIGCTGMDDSPQEYNDDVSIYYVSTNSILSSDFKTLQGLPSKNPSWLGRMGAFGEAFVQAPNHNRMASWYWFEPSGNIGLNNDESLWMDLRPGFYSHPANTIHDTIATRGSDGDYIYGSEYFSLDPLETERIVTVVAYGYAKEEVFQKILRARALWNAHFDTVLVRQGVTVTNFTSHRFLSGTVPINWTTQQTGGSVDIYFSSDAGRNWATVARGLPNTGTYSWNTASVSDCFFGMLSVYANDSSGTPSSFTQTNFFTINNNPVDSSPFVRILNPELNDTTLVEEPTYTLRLLMGNPASGILSVSLLYRVNSASPWTLCNAFATASDTNALMCPVRIMDLPNTDHFQFKCVVFAAGRFCSDSTDMFRKQTPRVIIPPANFHVLSGSAEVPVAVHIVDQSRVRSDTYVLTFDDTSFFRRKTFSVFDSSRGVYVLSNAAVQPGVESASFDGLALYTEDVVTSLNRVRSRWSRAARSYAANVLDTFVPGLDTVQGYRQPHDYKIVFHDAPVDTSFDIESLGLPAIPIPYHVLDAQTNSRVRVGAVEWGYGHEMVFVENVHGRDRFTWDVYVTFAPPDSAPREGDTLFLSMTKGLSIYDSLQVSNLTVSVGGGRTTPMEFTLYQNYPNPFNPVTNIEYSIPAGTRLAVCLQVYDLLGRQVATLVNEVKQPGKYAVQFDAGRFASGVYFYRLQAGGFVATRKLLLLK